MWSVNRRASDGKRASPAAQASLGYNKYERGWFWQSPRIPAEHLGGKSRFYKRSRPFPGLRFLSEPFLEGSVVRLFEGTRTITPAPPQLHSNHQRP